MSLLDRPPHKVEVQLMKKGENARGMPEDVPDGAPVVVRCMVQSVRDWATAEEERTYGLQLLDMRRIYARDWPGDDRALVYYEGDEYETIGTPQRMNVSPRTRHTLTTVRRRRKDPR